MRNTHSRHERRVTKSHQLPGFQGEFRVSAALVVAEFHLEDSVGELFHYGSDLTGNEALLGQVHEQGDDFEWFEGDVHLENATSSR